MNDPNYHEDDVEYFLECSCGWDGEVTADRVRGPYGPRARTVVYATCPKCNTTHTIEDDPAS